MATFVDTPSGWKAVIRRTGWPTACKTFRTKRDAEDWARRTEDEMVRGVYIQRSSSERLTLEVALKRYLAEVSLTKAEKTQDSEKASARALTSRLGKYSLAALSSDIIADYRDARLAEKTRRGTLTSKNSVRLELALLSHLFTVAIQEWRVGLPFNPVSNIRKPSPGQGRDRRLTDDEERRLLAAVANHCNPMLRWIFLIALETSMRSSEITGLLCRQVDINKRVVRLSDTKNGSARTVPLTKLATDIFEEALANPLRPKDCNLVFFGEPGKDGLRRPYTFSKSWNLLKKKLGISDLHFHDLRHEAVSRLVEGGLSDQQVSAITGHKSMQMLKRYAHLRAEELVDWLDNFPARTPSTRT